MISKVNRRTIIISKDAIDDILVFIVSLCCRHIVIFLIV
jgi:hypothetical protein